MAARCERLKNCGCRCGTGGEGEGEAGVFKGCDSFFEVLSDHCVSREPEVELLGAYLLGFELLVYSNAPTGLPTPVCAKVVEREIWNYINRCLVNIL